MKVTIVDRDPEKGLKLRLGKKVIWARRSYVASSTGADRAQKRDIADRLGLDDQARYDMSNEEWAGIWRDLRDQLRKLERGV